MSRAVYYLIEDPSSSHSATGLAMKLKVDERDCGNTSMFAARSVVERIEKTTGQPLPDLTQCAHTSVLHHIDGHLALSSSTLSSLASVQILRNETHSAEDGDDLFFIDVPRSGEKVCLRFRLPKVSPSLEFDSLCFADDRDSVFVFVFIAINISGHGGGRLQTLSPFDIVDCAIQRPSFSRASTGRIDLLHEIRTLAVSPSEAGQRCGGPANRISCFPARIQAEASRCYWTAILHQLDLRHCRLEQSASRQVGVRVGKRNELVYVRFRCRGFGALTSACRVVGKRCDAN